MTPAVFACMTIFSERNNMYSLLILCHFVEPCATIQLKMPACSRDMPVINPKKFVA